MSTSADAGRAIAGCQPAGGTPVTISAEAIESTAEPYLDQVKAALDDEGYVPAELRIDAAFDVDCSLTTQAEADRIRDLLRVADYLGASTVRLEIDCITDASKVQPALSALRERADRDGLTLVVDGIDSDDL